MDQSHFTQWLKRHGTMAVREALCSSFLRGADHFPVTALSVIVIDRLLRAVGELEASKDGIDARELNYMHITEEDKPHFEFILRDHLRMTQWMDGPDARDGSPPADPEAKARRATAKRLLADVRS